MFNNFTALYVEDEIDINETVCDVFGRLFKNFYTADNGKDALDLYHKYQDEIDIIISDINMPFMDGLTMAKEIKEINSNIPIIITTAHNDKDFLHRAIEVGVSSFVVKPMDIKILSDEVKRCMEPIILKQKLDKEIASRLDERVQNAKFTAIGQLAAGITHEINTPLTYIKASFELMNFNIDSLADCQEKENIKGNIEHINDGICRIENIINSMKEMFNQSKIEKSDCNIYSTLVTAIVLAYNKSKHISNIYLNDEEFNLNCDKEKESYIASVEKQRLEQVWVIIINNAMDELMKIEEFDKRRLEIDIKNEDEDVCVYFRDNAGGIDEEVMADLFKPFKGTKESSGMGVGLSIAKKIIDNLDGKIEAYNEGEGAVFRVCLKKYK